MQEFYEAGNKAVTQVDWIKYFLAVATIGKDKGLPQLTALANICSKFLQQHAKKADKTFFDKAIQ